MGLQVIRTQTHALGPEKTHGAQISLFELVNPNDFALGCIQCCLVPRHIHLQYFGRAKEAVGVLSQAENTGALLVGLVCPDPLENTETVVESVRQNMDFCFLPGNQLSI